MVNAESKIETVQIPPLMRWRGAVIPLLVLVLALAVRLSRIASESVDHEEFVSFVHLDAPGLFAFLRDVQGHYPFSSPLPYAFQYLWTRVAGTDPACIRLFSVLTGMLTIYLLFLLTRFFYAGKPWATRAASTAALCAALSPMHVFHSQEGRQYAILTLFGVLSLYTFLKAWRTGRGAWWAANMAANAGALWSHHLAVLILPVEGLVLLLSGRSRIKETGVWLIVHLALCVPVGLWVLSVDVPPEDEIFSNYAMPAAENVVMDIVGDDVPYLHTLYPEPAANAWRWVGPELREQVLTLRPWLGGALVCFFAVSLAWAIINGATAFRMRRRSNGHAPAAAEWLLLLLWMVVPVLAITFLTFAWKPCYSNRYTAYAPFALYLFVGGTIGAIPRNYLRWLAAGVCGALYAYQLSLSLPGPTRTDWKAVSRHIEQEGGPADIILVEDPFWLPEFLFNAGPSRRVASDAFERDALAEIANFALSLCAEEARARGVWVLLVDTAYRGGADFESVLVGRNLAFDSRRFPGERPVIAYHLGPDAAPVSRNAADTVAAFAPVTEALSQRLPRHANETALETFREFIRYWPDWTGAAYVRLGIALGVQQDTHLAAATLLEGVRRNPEFASRLAFLLDALETASSEFTGETARIYDAAQLVGAERYEQAIARLADSGDDGNALALWLLWRAASRAGDEATANGALRRLYLLAPDPPAPWSPLYPPLRLAQDHEAARRTAEQLRSMGIPVPEELRALLDAASVPAATGN